jgi:hypothetical protein
MIKIGKIIYYIDLSAIEKAIGGDKDEFKAGVETNTETIQFLDENGKITSTQIITRVLNKPREIDVTKYDQINSMLQVLMGPPDEEMDESMGAQKGFEKQSTPFKLAFNTLTFYGIIKEL